jgi:hypothetical protein
MFGTKLLDVRVGGVAQWAVHVCTCDRVSVTDGVAQYMASGSHVLSHSPVLFHYLPT